jgi:Putative zinc-finger
MIHGWRMQRALVSFHEGELPRRNRAALAAHLERCPGCAAALRRLAESDRLLAAARPDAEALSPETAERILQRALAQAGARRRHTRQPSQAPVGLAVALFLAGALLPAWIPDLGAWLHPKPAETAPAVLQARLTSPPAPPRSGEGSKATARGTSPSPLRGGGQGERLTAATVRPRDPLTPIKAGNPHRLERASSSLRFGEGSRSQPSPSSHDPVIAASAGPDVNDDTMLATNENPPAARMLIMRTAGHVDDLVTVRQAPAETPGYARVAALLPDGNGDFVWIQSIVSSARPGSVLALSTLAESDLDP